MNQETTETAMLLPAVIPSPVVSPAEGFIPIVQERSCQRFDSLGALEVALRSNPVFETEAFPLNRARLDAGGRLYTPMGDFYLSAGALKDIVSQCGLGHQAATTIQRNGLPHVVEYAANEFFRAQSEKKMRKIVYHGTSMGNVMITLPSQKYALTPHLRVVERVMESIPESLRFDSATLDAEQMKLVFLDPDSNLMEGNHVTNTEGMKVGEIIKHGLSIVGGYRYQALTSFIELLRLACLNGMTVMDKAWGSRTIHKRPSDNSCILSSDFGKKLEAMLPLMGNVGQGLRGLKGSPVTPKLLHDAQRKIAEVPTFSRQQAGELLAPFAAHANIEWGFEGELPAAKRMGDLTTAEDRFDLLNLVTQLGRDAESFKVSHALSQVGGWLILN